MENIILKKYCRYFDPNEVGKKYIMTAEQERGIEEISKAYKIDTSDLRMLVKLAFIRNKIQYTSNEMFLDQIDQLYNGLKTSSPPTLERAPIKELKITFLNGKTVKVTNELLLTNLCYLAQPFLEPGLKYIESKYKPRISRKNKGKNNSGRPKANKILMIKMLNFLELEYRLQQKEIGNIIAKVFDLGKNRINGSGKSLYDTIKNFKLPNTSK